MIQNLREKLLSLLREDALGIIWVTDTSFKDIEDNFEVMDYLFDGLLTQNKKEFQKENLKESPTHLLLTQHFGKTFFLGQVTYSSQVHEHIESYSKVLRDESRKKIFLVNDSPHKIKANIIPALHVVE